MLFFLDNVLLLTHKECNIIIFLKMYSDKAKPIVRWGRKVTGLSGQEKAGLPEQGGSAFFSSREELRIRNHEKNVVYSMIMSSRLRVTLQEAANSDCHSVASLLDKIVTDYLAKEEFLRELEPDKERRKFSRKKINMPAITIIKERSEEKPFPCAVFDISMGGALIAYTMTSTSMVGLPHF